MKIYQIHEYGGQYEDYFDYIVVSYLDKNKAIEKMTELEKEEKLAAECRQCPLHYCSDECGYDDCENCNSERLKEFALKVCNRFIPVKDSEGEWTCEVDGYNRGWDDLSYRIEEVEVIE